MKISPILAMIPALISLSLFSCNKSNEPEESEQQSEQEHQKILVTSPKAKDVIITQQYVCQIHSQRHINVCAFVNGYLQESWSRKARR